MTQKMFGWEMDRNVEDFFQVSKNMREEGHHSRADVVDYLIARVRMTECKLARKNDSLEMAKEQAEASRTALQHSEDRVRELIMDESEDGWR
jgi:hypothetical protein